MVGKHFGVICKKYISNIVYDSEAVDKQEDKILILRISGLMI